MKLSQNVVTLQNYNVLNSYVYFHIDICLYPVSEFVVDAFRADHLAVDKFAIDEFTVDTFTCQWYILSMIWAVDELVRLITWSFDEL